MRKIIAYVFLFILAFGLVSAIEDNETLSKGKTNLEIIKNISQGNLDNTPSEEQLEATVTGSQLKNSGESENGLQNGNLMREQNQIRIGGQNLNCSGNCTYNMSQDRIQVKLSNGKNAEVKIMPETASKTAIERLKLNSCNESNCTIALKEVGKDNSTKLAYEINATKQAKFLGIFKTNVKVRTEVDVETGEVISVKKPWWVSL